MLEIRSNAAMDSPARPAGTDYSNVYEQVLALQKQHKSNPEQLTKNISGINEKLHSQGILPNIDITGVDKEGHFTALSQGHQLKVVASDVRDQFEPGKASSGLQGAANIGSELAKGVYDELAHHKDRLLMSAGTGLGAGFLVALAAPPAVAAGLTVLGLGYGGYQIYKHAGEWIKDAKITANPLLYSPTEVTKAHQGVEGFGAGALDLGVGIAAGMAGGYAGRTVKMNLEARAASTATDIKQAQSSNEVSDSSQKTGPAKTDQTSLPAQGPKEVTDIAPKAETLASGSDLRKVTDVDSFRAQTDRVLAAHKGGEKVEIQISMAKQLTDAHGNPMYLGADGNPVIKTTTGAVDAFTDTQGRPLHLNEQQIADLKPLNQGRMLGKILAERDPANWHPNLVKPSPGLEPAPPETQFTAVQPANTYLSNDGAPLNLAKPVTVADKLPIYDASGKPILTPNGAQATTTEIPAGARLSYGTIFHDGKLQSVDPTGSVWAKTPDGNLIRLTQAGEVRTGFDASKFAVNEKGIFGQPTAGKVVIVRDGGAVLPDGKPVLDAYPSNLETLNKNIVLRQPEGNNLGAVVSKPIVLPHYDVPNGMDIKITMNNGGTQIASGASVGDNKGFLWNPDSGYPNWEKVVAQTGAPRNADGTLDLHTAELIVKTRGWATQAGNALKEFLATHPLKGS